MVTAAWFTWWINLSASSSVTSLRLSRPTAPPALFRATWLLLGKFFCGFPKLLPSPSLVAALMMLLREGAAWLELLGGGVLSEGV